MTGHVVISGAGIAGPALAHELLAHGWRATVLERHPQRREGGQNVDVRGAAREVARRMGIDEAILAANTGEVGMRFVREDGSAAAEYPVDPASGSDGPTAEREILRGELSRILYERTADGAEYRFGVQIAEIDDREDAVTVTLDDGSTITADLVVIAEGLRSTSRRFVTDADFEDLGMYFAYLTLPRLPGDDAWWNWQHAPGNRAVHLRPDNLGTTRAMLSFITSVRGLETLRRADQIAILRRTFADVGGHAPRVLEHLDQDPNMYFDGVGRVRSPRWSKGRVALLGDSAFCNATFGGLGTSMALIGSYVLAGELAGTDDHRVALARYEQSLRPYLEGSEVDPDRLRFANPRTRTGIRVMQTGARVAFSAPGRAVMKVLGRGLGQVPADEIELPHYPRNARLDSAHR